MRGGKEINGNRKVEQRMQKGKKPNRKNLHAVRKGECGGKSGKDFPKNRPKSDPERGKTRKKWASRGKKRERVLEKVPENGLKTGKVGKTEILERKRRGGVEAEKWALLPILQCYEVTKSAQMKFSRIFFR